MVTNRKALTGLRNGQSRFASFMIIFLTFLFILVISLGFMYYRQYYTTMYEDIERTLTAVSILKASQVHEWRNSILQTAYKLEKSGHMKTSVQNVAVTGTQQSRQDLDLRIAANMETLGAIRALLIDQDEKAIYIHNDKSPINGTAGDSGNRLTGTFPGTSILQTNSPVLSELYFDAQEKRPLIDVIIPMGKLRLVISIDPSIKLYPLILNWPTADESAESLLVREEGNRVVYLNELRHRSGTALQLTAPVESPKLISAMAVRGARDMIYGEDYRGIPSIANVQAIEGSSWILINKIDRSEALSGWIQFSRLTFLFIILTSVLFILLAILVRMRTVRKELENRIAMEARLRLSQERYHTTLMSVGDAVIATDSQGRVEFMNPVAENLTGWDFQTAKGLPVDNIFVLVDEIYGNPIESPVRQVLESGKFAILSDHAILVAKDGTRRPITDSGAPILEQEQTVSGAVLIFRDQTHDQNLQNALRESEKKLRLINESSVDYIYSYDLHGRYTSVNRSLCEGMGLQPEQILGKTHRDLGYPEKLCQAWDALHLKVKEEGKVVRERTSTQHLPEAERFWEVILTPLRDESGVIIGISGITRDITELQTAEQKLAELGHIFNLFLKHNPLYVFIKDKTGRTLHLSDNYSHMLGMDISLAIGKTMDELFPSELAIPMIEDDRKTMTNGVLVEKVEEHNGRTYSTIKFPIFIEGKAQYLAGYTMDITERVAAARSMEELNQRLEERVRERTKELRTANRELEAFASSVSHDLRSPLRAMDGFCQLLATRHAERLDAEAKHYIERIQEGARRMGQLINDLLGLSRISRSDLTRKSVDLSGLAARIFKEFVAEDAERSVTISIREGMRVDGDPALIEIALRNLIGNAWKFTGGRSNPRIEAGCIPSMDSGPAADHGATAGHPDPEVEYFIRDNGVGFDMAHATKLFTPFQRLHGMTEFPGTGIGLATVRRIMEKHGGSIRVEAAPGAGATFYFTLKPSEKKE